MSKIGKAPIDIPEKIDVSVENGRVCAKNGNGQKKCQQYDEEFVSVEINEEDQIQVSRKGNAKQYRERHGLYRSLIASMIKGLDKPYEKKLQIEGLGYRARVQGNKLILELGYSHPIEYDLPDGINAEVDDSNQLVTISGSDKHDVGQVAANIRDFRPPEPYKGKGIRYKGEEIIRKEGKLSGGEEAGIGS